MAVEAYPAQMFVVRQLLLDPEMQRLVRGRVYDSIAPENATFPLVLVSYSSTLTTTQAGTGRRVQVRPLFVVQAVCRDGSAEPAALIANQVDRVLVDARGMVTHDTRGYHVRGSIRETEIKQTIVTDGIRHHYVEIGRAHV